MIMICLILFFNPKGERHEIHSCTFFPSKKVTYHIKRQIRRCILQTKQADNRVIDF